VRIGKIPVFSSCRQPRYAAAMDIEPKAARNSARRDLAIVIGVLHWMRPLESLQLDQLPGILL
jgi:hypothetical protein